MKVQRKIVSACETLEYYMLNLFVFQTETYNAAVGRLNEIDKQIFYDRSRVNQNRNAWNFICILF